MKHRTCVVWDEAFTRYNFGPDHPMNPLRLDLTAQLCAALGVFSAPGVDVRAVEPIAEELLLTVHTPRFVEAVQLASADPRSAAAAHGLGTDDDPAFLGMHDSSARIVAATLEAVRSVWHGTSDHGVNFTGGLHHAMPDRASGFCVYNDAAVAIRWLLAQGAERVAYVDIDAHHGDGVEEVFKDDPRVLTVSVHETGRVLFPGTGFPGDIGGRGAQGTAVNVALAPGTNDMQWLRAVHAIVPSVVRAFAPQFLITQHGADSHVEDPLAHLCVTVDAQRAAAEILHAVAHEVCDGRWVALGGGGYEITGVVPRSWTHVTAIAAHTPIATSQEVPERWIELVRERLRERHGADSFGDRLGDPAHAWIPESMGDLPSDSRVWFKPWDTGHDPDAPCDRAIMATREAVFPFHGLDVYYD